MSFDISRFTFNPRNDYAGVVMEQGRVQTDADWNEGLAEISRRIQAGALDALGHAVFPATTPYAFLIEPATDPKSGANTIRIGVGRMYVDGLLVENHGAPPTTWDPALAELSNTPQPPPSLPLQPLDDSNSILFSAQPYNPSPTLPSGNGPFLAYLDVWRRPISFIEDPSLVDPAIGVDTSGRVQTAWQVKLMAMPAYSVTGSVTSGAFDANEAVVQTNSGASASLIGTVTGSNPLYLGAVAGTPDATDTWVGQTSKAVFTPTATPATASWTCQTPDSAIPWPTSAGQLSTATVSSGPSGPCCLTTGVGYTGFENQLYRVEIHAAGGGGGSGATFKWSRENASVQTNVTAIGTGKNALGDNASVLTVQSLGRDQVLGFSPGNWIEITDQTHDDNGLPGELYQIDSVQPANLTVTLTGLLSSTFQPSSLTANAYTRLCRWDQSGQVYDKDNNLYWDLDAHDAGDIPVPTDGTVLILENGVTVQFGLSPATGAYLPMNYWTFAARTATATIDLLTDAPPNGPNHHYTKLATVSFAGTPSATDCRTPWPSGGGQGACGCCTTCTVGVGGTYSTITQALAHLPPSGGEIVILPGVYYEAVALQGLTDVVIRGCGRQTVVCSPSLQPGAPAATPPASGLSAVFTLEDCKRVELTGFCVTTAEVDIGVLIDRSSGGAGNSRITIKAMTLTAAARPAVAARAVSELWVFENIISVTDRDTLYPAVYLRGEDLLFERNQVGPGSARTAPGTAPQPQTPGSAPSSATASTGATDMMAKLKSAQIETSGGSPSADKIITINEHRPASALGGVQVGGSSKNVCILENRISGGARNGITLGDVITLDAKGRDTGDFNGVIVGEVDDCAPPSGGLPSGGSGSGGGGFAAGGLIENLIIDRNWISDQGMCGIGPVGFFDLETVKEVVSLTNVSITENIISRTLLLEMAPFNKKASSFGYGAISLPDVQNLTIRDNTVTDFGITPSAAVCGIFVLHGEGIEISRNQIRQTRDSQTVYDAFSGAYDDMRAGIYIALVTPPVLDSTADSPWTKAYVMWKAPTQDIPLFEPGLPALRIQENVVRVAIGLALAVIGAGPFEIANNHFSTGGGITLREDPAAAEAGALSARAFSDPGVLPSTPALTVAIVNLGEALELTSLAAGFSGLLQGGDVKGAALSSAPSGAVQFSSNVCQFEGRASRARGLCSVGILSLDHIHFGGNHLWFDAAPLSALADGLLIGGSIQAVNNRWQEAAEYPVILSGVTAANMNITTNNISTYCLYATAPKVGGKQFLVEKPNLELLCEGDIVKRLSLTGAMSAAERAK